MGNVYIAIETKTRELEAKILLSCLLAQFGHRVILGHKVILDRNLSALEPGVYIDKSCAVSKLAKFRALKALGHRVLTHDEEGLVNISPEAYLDLRVSGEALAEIDTFFAWGESQAGIVRKAYPEAAHKIIATGNPRFDLLRPELRGVFSERCQAIRRAHGRYVLIATKFGANNVAGGQETVIRRELEAGLIKTDEQLAFRRGYFEARSQLLAAFVEMLPKLSAALPDRRIILRPHPSERLDFWEDAASGCQNVSVVREGNIHPWILGAEVMIHNGCTTAIESTILGVPAIAYRPVRFDRFDIELPNSVSREVETIDNLVAAVQEMSDGGPARERERHLAVLGHHVTALKGELAAERIAATISSHASQLAAISTRRHRYGQRAQLRAMRHWLGMIVRRYVQPATPHPKFPEMSVHEVERFVDRLARWRPAFAAVDIRRFDQNCVEFSFSTATKRAVPTEETSVA